MRLNKPKLIAVILCLLCFQYSYPQTPYNELEKFSRFISKNTNIDKVKDSLAYYACYIKISVDRKDNYKPVIKSNDEQASKLVANIDKLAAYDYRKLMGGSKSVIFILPVSIIVTDSPHNPKRFDATINNKVSKLFYAPMPEDEHRKIAYLWPVTYIIDTRVYD